MKTSKLEAKIASIEAQLKVLKASKDVKKSVAKKKDLRSLKGILKGEEKFAIEEIKSVKIIFREKL